MILRRAECLVFRLEADRTFERTCRRADFRLEGMGDGPHDTEVAISRAPK